MRTRVDEADFGAVAKALACWPTIPVVPDDISTPAARLLDAMRMAVEQPRDVGPADLAVLLRHMLRADAELTGSSNGLRVPESELWPGPQQCQKYGLRSTADRFVFADAWSPRWLASTSDPSAPALRGAHVESLGATEPVEADPFITRLAGVSQYRSAGQREAIRTVLASQPSTTIIGNLPTGSGKSLVGYAPALLATGSGTTIVVVPTTALALDQERAFLERIAQRPDHDHFPAQLAYYGELAESDKLAIRERIATGSQRIVFTSPESVKRSLSSVLYTAAERGLLVAFVVDEAHIVSQWGAEFRPEFQALASIRGDLLRTALDNGTPFRTILLSATLTEESVLTLQNLFGHPGPTEFISSVALRHEPSYWLATSDSEDERVKRIDDCICHLPRPLVLYTTRLADAKRWYEHLESEGFRRLKLVTSETSAEDRKSAISRLREGSLDLVVATSAFGLGVDQPDLRAVVHACIPETIDRYYQEAGRGGRDGLPSLSVLVSAPRDVAVADQLSRRKLITLGRGFERWQLMQSRAEDAGEGLLRVPLWTAPADLSGDNAETRAWNMRTLLLMDRSGLIRLEAIPPPRRAPGETDVEWEERATQQFEEYAGHAILRVLEGNLASQTVWKKAVGDTRWDATNADRIARTRMGDALEPDADVCSLFAAAYHLERPVPGIPDGQIPVPVAASCGGCPGCRAKGLPPRRYLAPTPLPARSLDRSWAASFLPWFGGQAALTVTYDDDDTWQDVSARVVERLARLGMWCLAGNTGFMAMAKVRELHRIAPHRAVFHLERWDPLHAPNLPTALIYGPSEPVDARALAGRGAKRVVITSASTRHPSHPTSLITEYHSAVIGTVDILERL